MIGDVIQLKPHHYEPAHKIVESIMSKLSSRHTIAISGESGCGKSTLSVALKDTFDKEGLKSFILHMDDYFILPPATNHNNRLKSLDNVGPQEVKLDLLQSHLNAFKNGERTLTKPLVHYKENEIRSEQIDFTGIDILIVEGTYTLGIEVDTKIFMTRNYKDTLQARIERARDPLTPFVEQVLEIEHNIIKKFEEVADILVDKEYDVKFVNAETKAQHKDQASA
jgi:uridine kinase